ncbi:hypothetical protein JX265_000735 [Neoarthrinium moseri]|uniref:Uncharacterized protein n=1 Tax=Neoarthrinium moseri TaxID=1658444 RepID=A0A9Q0AUI0_9PEZI|nr:uncharacterized protein JN550_013583 [Neoarthrinium moseri]KAI1840347.1 hypothetical protein JX266_013440 [Neoarthrinium moseri]KAI1856913.1 hypothetical protein JN550_013583 [Neoarthrinium moseri]KAI1880495.1 hypothetical protein JX265_000735 [Neoarthrinium moseri]
MKHFVVSALATLASATTYRLTVFAPGTVIDGADVEAATNGFYLGLLEPSTYCPSKVGTCPPVQGTLVYEGMSGMAVEVPGGQQIYVDSSGMVKYTQAHSSYVPQGAFITGWFNKTVVSSCEPAVHVVDFLAADGMGSGGILLCRDVQSFMDGTGASYQLFVQTAQLDASSCVPAIGLLQHESAAQYGAWQYT